MRSKHIAVLFASKFKFCLLSFGAPGMMYESIGRFINLSELH